MSIFMLAVLPWLAVFAVHFIWWRLALPSRQLRTILILFFVGFLLLLALAIGCPAWLAADRAAWWWSLVYSSALYWSAAFFYVITYSAMEGDSPTLALVLELRKAGRAGLTPEELEQFFARRPFLKARMSKLVTDGMLRESGDEFCLAGGRSLAFDLILWWRRAILGFKEWGG